MRRGLLDATSPGGRRTAAKVHPAPNDDVPFVSIAIIVYNKKTTIEDCLSSLLDLDYPREKYEVVVVDGGSTDGTLKLLQKFPVTLLVETRRCRGAARNMAVTNSKGQMIAFVDADCIPNRSWLRDHVSLHRDPDVLVVTGAVDQGGSRSLPATILHRAEFSALSPLGLRRPTWEVATCNASFKRSVFTLIGPFPDLDLGEDSLLGWKVVRAGFGVIFDPKPRVVHLHEAMNFGSVLSKIWRQGGTDRILQDEFGSEAPYQLPRGFVIATVLSPALLVVRLGRYFGKFLSSSPRRTDPLKFLPILVALSISWTLGYLASSWERR